MDRIIKWNKVNRITTWRLLILSFIILIFSFGFHFPFLTIAFKENLRLSPLSYPILMNDHIANLALKSAYLPSLSYVLRGNVLARSSQDSKKKYVLFSGYINIIIFSLLYTILIQISCFICILPVVEWNSFWSNGWRVLASPELMIKYNISLPINSFLMTKFTGLDAYLFCCLLDFLSLVFLGSIILVFSSNKHYSIGAIISASFLILDMGIQNLVPPLLAKISPITLSMLECIVEYDDYLRLTVRDTFQFYCISPPLLFLISLILQKKNIPDSQKNNYKTE